MLCFLELFVSLLKPLVMEKFPKYKKHEVCNAQGEVVIINWLVEADDLLIVSTLPLPIVHFFCRQLFPTCPSVLDFDREQITFCFEAFNRYTEENVELLSQKLPGNAESAKDTCLDTLIFAIYERWTPPAHVSIIDAEIAPLDFSHFQEDIYAFTEFCLPWLTAVNYQNDMEFISRSAFEQKLQNQEQIDYYLDHYKQLNDDDVVYLAMYEDHANFFMPIKDNMPLFIFVEHHIMEQDEAA